MIEASAKRLYPGELQKSVQMTIESENDRYGLEFTNHPQIVCDLRHYIVHRFILQGYESVSL